MVSPAPSTLAEEPLRIAVTDTAFFLEIAGPDGAERTLFDPDVNAVKQVRSAGGEQLDLILEDCGCLDLSFSLPEASVKDLRAMIETEVAFQSPVSLDKAHWCWSAVYREGATGNEAAWHVEVAVCLAERLDPLIQAIHQGGLTVKSVRRRRSVAPDWVAHPEWAQPKEASDRSVVGYASRLGKLPPMVLVPVAAVLLFVLVAAQQALTLVAEIHHVSGAASSARADLARALQDASRRQTLENESRLSSLRLVTIARTAAALPDDTWLEALSIDGNELELSGSGPSAARTTEDLAQIPSLNALRFAAPISRNSRQSTERFRIAGYLDDLPGVAEQ